MDEGVISDPTEFMVLALQLYDVCWESILGIAIQNALGGEGTTMMHSTQGSKGFSVLPGFAPAGEGLLDASRRAQPLLRSKWPQNQ
ncbi:MAG: hypothetical protein H0W49_11090 [Nitrospirales bacterium]|nr:hypothetical protein [Nitrospirales bacterium]MBA3964920.1 hypothetical protein [Nitrospirales bacterium]